MTSSQADKSQSSADPALEQEEAAVRPRPEQCPACKQPLDFIDQRIINQVKDQILTHGECGSCGSYLLLFEFGRSGAVLSAALLVTDLVADDVERFQGQPPISDNDVIAIHNWLTQQSSTPVRTRR